MTAVVDELATCLHKKLPKPRRWRISQVRICPDCGITLACLIWGYLAPHPRWLRWDINDKTATTSQETTP